MIFEPNITWTDVEVKEAQYKVTDFGKIDPFGKPYYIGILTSIREDRPFAAEKNLLQIAQPADIGHTIINYKIICIQKNENYIKVLIDNKYLVKFILQRSYSCNYK